MGDPLPPLGGPTVNAPPGSPPPVFPMRDLPRELTDEILASYLAKLELEELCEAKLLQICILLRGTNQCNDPDDPLWKAACARFGLTERLVGGLPDAPATPTWHVTFLAMCKEVATLEPDELEVYKGLLRGDDTYEDGPFSDDDDSDDDADEEAPPQRRLRSAVVQLWFHAVFGGLLCVVHFVLRRVDGIVHADDDEALRAASRYGHAAVVEVLLAHGADVHARDDAALRGASDNGHLAVVKALLAHGADVQAHNDEALLAASRNGHDAVVEVLLAHGADVHARDSNDVHADTFLLHGGLRLDTALRAASRNGHLAVVERLLAHGANVHAGNDVALWEASLKGHLAVVEVLLVHGADVHAFGGWALRWAREKGHAAIEEVLRAAGATEE